MPTAHTIAGEPVLEGKYHLELRLGQGGMGVVYKARHAYLKTLHAIKIILPDLVGNDPQLVTRFRQEALAAAAIRHQNVVNTTDYGVIQGTLPFLVMEYVEGESLHDLLTREKALAPERALELMSAICAGVGAAHHQGIVHRDLKPLNIMICKDKPSLSQAVKILDFGLAKIKSGELLGSFIQAQTTGLMGSPYYMAPEQWADEEPDSRADVYSLGVMLFQMLAGDVPFKGSSIPAIMKKHISDPPPTFAEVGVRLSPEIELAVRHTLQKEPAKRTASVEILVEELKRAIDQSSGAVHSTAGQALPVSSLRIRTNPPGSKVFIDNVPVGESRDSGLLLLEGIQSGNHHVRISHEGFSDWQGDVVCDGKPQEVIADLSPPARTDSGAIPKPTSGSILPADSISGMSPREFAETQRSQPVVEGTQEPWQTAGQGVFVETQPTRSLFFSPWILGGIGVIALFALGAIGIVVAYMLGIIPGIDTGNVNQTPTPTPTASPVISIKPDLVVIPGGTFTMGRNDGKEDERPEHQVQVGGFQMDRTEVTNAEYLAFVSATNHKPVPVHWENNKPLRGQEQMPVRYVSLEDTKAFAEWRSQRDGVRYRLPTEQEWEYAARNGSKGNLYPWDDKFEARCAVVEQNDDDATKPVGTASCPNEWGVQDLIGNVIEWTSTPISLYPGNKGEIKPGSENHYAVRGGSARYKSTGEDAITATYRRYAPANTRNAALGFRLVRSE